MNPFTVAILAICAALVSTFGAAGILWLAFFIFSLFEREDWAQCQDCNVWHNVKTQQTSFSPPDEWSGAANFRTCPDCIASARENFSQRSHSTITKVAATPSERSTALANLK
jgi:hypothetical protein